MKSTLVLAGFTFLSALADCTCNTKDSGNTGKNEDTSPPPTCTVREWQLVAAGYMASCGLHTDGCIECWGNEIDEDDWNIFDSGGAAPPGGSFKSVAMSAVHAGGHDETRTSHACAIVAEDNSAVCRRYSSAGQTTPVPGAYELLTLGYTESCGLTVDGDVNCWPGRLEMDSSHKYTHIDAGYDFICGITTEGTIDCDYYDWQEPFFTLPSGSIFTLVAASAVSHGCALDTTGHVSCWNSYDSCSTDFSGPVEMLDINENVSCGILMDAQIECPCDSYLSWWEPPEGTFSYISVGSTHACAVSTEGEMECWGDDSYGQSSPPE